jgi:thioesterase domain-containing protein/acyl carrier protein
MSTTNMRYLNPKDRQIYLYSASFAASAGPIFSTLLNGACLYPYEIKKQGLVKLANFIVKERITIFSSVPSTFRYFATLLGPEKTFPEVRLVTMGGDTVLKNDIDLYKKCFPSSCHFVNSLGGTEFFSIRSFMISKDTQIKGGIVPIGYEVEDKKVLLLDDKGAEVPTGDVGEIVVQSKYVANGYWRRPELTKEKFVLVPGQDGVIQYRTGDLGRMDPDGCLYHLGRKDRQVKIRGHRVELGEIISALLDSPSIEDAYVKAHTDPDGESQLVAYLVPVKQSESLVEGIVGELTESLPSYMIPTEFIVLDEIPKTPSRKVDALALPEPEKNRSSRKIDYVEPRNSIERKLVEIWETLLEFQPIGVKDDFFELGGHSLLALRLIAEIEDKFEVKVPFAALVQVRTIDELATILQDKDSLQTWSHLVALQPLGTKTPFFCVPPSAVTVMVFKDLAKYMSEERPFYALEYTGMDEGTETHKSIAAMASFNIEKIRSVQPEGPYYLGGMCFGGIVAYEMAKQLLEAGERVAFLGILDSTHAPYLSRPRSYPVFMLTRFINQKILRQKFPIGMAPLERAMKKFAPDDDFSHRIYDVFTTHNYARVKYITTPYPETITLFNTAGSRGDFSRDKWKEVAGGKLEIVSIPGVHGGVRVDLQEGEQSFIHEPMVQIFAHRLNESLETVV